MPSRPFDPRLCRLVTDADLREQLLLLTCLLDAQRCTEPRNPCVVWRTWVDMCEKGRGDVSRDVSLAPDRVRRLLCSVLFGQAQAERWGEGEWPDQHTLMKKQNDLWNAYNEQLTAAWRQKVSVRSGTGSDASRAF